MAVAVMDIGPVRVAVDEIPMMMGMGVVPGPGYRRVGDGVCMIVMSVDVMMTVFMRFGIMHMHVDVVFREEKNQSDDDRNKGNQKDRVGNGLKYEN